MKDYTSYKTHLDFRKEHCIYTGQKPIQFPYSIIIRTQPNGMIWQLYHIKNHTDRIHEKAIILNAYNKGYEDIRIEFKCLTDEETYPNWRAEVPQVKVINK